MGVGYLSWVLLFAVLLLSRNVLGADENAAGIRDIIFAMMKAGEAGRAGIQKEITKLKADVQDINKMKDDIKDLMSHMLDLETAIEQVKADNGVVQKDVGVVKSNTDSLLGDVDDVKESVNEMKSDVDALELDVAKLVRESCKAGEVEESFDDVQRTLNQLNMTTVRSSVCHRENLIREYCGTTPARPTTTSIATTTTTTTPRVCTGGYVSIPSSPGRCYAIIRSMKTFYQAQQYCQNEGGNLVQLEEIGESEALVSYAQSNWNLRVGNQCPWAGGRYLNGAWRWVVGDSGRFTYNHFYKSGLGQPSRCLCICLDRNRDMKKYWWTCDCNRPPRYFVCEK